MRVHCYFVYILTNCSRRPLYTGVTNALIQRYGQHLDPEPASTAYTARYKLTRVVHFERYKYVINAIAREKQLKGWSRPKKAALIESGNPNWDDLSRTWREPVDFEELGRRLLKNQGPSTAALRASTRDDNS
ncbi:MAG: GIY-YIG nuclease family protein [Acidobacteriales bacterium]|nr:GIY-YIG nuclease family protein [Terriglobales bacterium]